MPLPPCNLRSVARASGVSVATASLALRDRPEIAAKTRERVRAVADKLGYRLNPLIGELMCALRHRKKRQRTTMVEIAARAGVSRATVSLVLRHPTRASAGMVARISAALRELGYSRDPLHEALLAYRRSNATHEKHTTIAFLTAYPPGLGWRDFTSHQQMYEGASKRAAELGYNLEEFSLSTTGMSPRRLRNILLARSVHAIVVAPTNDRSRRLDFDLESFACVGLGFSVGWPRIERVSNDHFQSISLAMRECRRLGYKRIGLLVSRAVSERLGSRWLGGYLLCQQEYPARERLTPMMPEDAEAIAPNLPRWLRSQRPDVIIYGNEEIGDTLSHLLDPSIGLVNLHVHDPESATTGIYQASSEVGARAVDAVVSQLHHNTRGAGPNPSGHLIPGRWVVGLTAPGRGRNRPL